MARRSSTADTLPSRHGRHTSAFPALTGRALRRMLPAGAALAGVLLASTLPGGGLSARQDDTVDAAALRAHVAFLASPDMGGRAAGSVGGRIAANYIASTFERLGLPPAGDGTSYFQTFEVQRARADVQQLALRALVGGEPRAFSIGMDFGLLQQGHSPASLQAPLVFAGYGISAPEFSYDDYAGIDVRGKVVLVLPHEPRETDPASRFKGRWNTLHAYEWQQLVRAWLAGAAALLLVDEPPHRPPPEPSGPSDLELESPPFFALPPPLWDIPAFLVTTDTAEALLRPGGRTLQALRQRIDADQRPASFVVPDVSVTIQKAFTDADVIDGRNVAALLPGSDPALRDEIVVVAAHYDHVGTAADRVFPGADDNASGVAALLEIATSLAHAETRPKRSILLLAFDAEERGLLGAFHYVDHPIVPLARTVAVINLDMIGGDEQTPTWPGDAVEHRNSVNVVGTRYSPAVRQAIEASNAAVGLTLDFKTDEDDREAWFARSDHFAFATRQVPHVLLNTGEHPDYHTEHDTADRLNYPKMAKITRLALLAARRLADGERPAFTPD